MDTESSAIYLQYFRAPLSVARVKVKKHETKDQNKMREIVHIQAGQCGNQIGAKVSPCYSLSIKTTFFFRKTKMYVLICLNTLKKLWINRVCLILLLLRILKCLLYSNKNQSYVFRQTGLSKQNAACHHGLHRLPLIQQHLNTTSVSKLYLFKF